MKNEKLTESNWTIRNETLKIDQDRSFEKNHEELTALLQTSKLGSLVKLDALQKDLFGKK